MVNYIRSEFYRNTKNRNLKIMVIVFALLITLLMFALVTLNRYEVNFPYANTRYALGNVYAEMSIMLTVLIFICMIIDDSESRHHTIKHSVAFGIPRKTIYLGRFLVQAVIATIIYAVMTSALAILAYLLLEHSNVGEYETLFRVSVGGYTCLLASLAAAFYFVMNHENQAVAVGNSMVTILAVPIVCNTLGRKIPIFDTIASLLPYNILAYNGPLVNPVGNATDEIIKSLLIGLVWIVAFLGLGLIQYENKEIK